MKNLIIIIELYDADFDLFVATYFLVDLNIYDDEGNDIYLIREVPLTKVIHLLIIPITTSIWQ